MFKRVTYSITKVTAYGTPWARELNGMIKYEWLNLSAESFKIKMKNIFLTSQLLT